MSTTTPDTEPNFTPLDAPVQAADAFKLLRQPFAANQIGLLPRAVRKNDQDKYKCEPANGRKVSVDGKYCGGFHSLSLHLDFVGHAATTDRLLDADPEWSWEPVAFGPDGLPAFDRSGGLWIRLTIRGVTRLGYGAAEGKNGPDATKEAIGDAIRNAAMRFGVALDLWHKGDLHAEEQQEPAQAPVQGANQSRPIQGPPAAAQGQQQEQQHHPDPQVWVEEAQAAKTEERMKEVFAAARRAGSLGAQVTVAGRTGKLGAYLEARLNAFRVNPNPLGGAA